AAEWNSLDTFMLPVADHLLLDGSNICAVLNTLPHRSPPPDISTHPSGRRMAACPVPTGEGSLLVSDHFPVAGSYVSAVTFRLHSPLEITPPAARTRP